MKKFKDTVLLVATIVLVISSVVSFAESSSPKSVNQLMDILAKDPNEHARIRAAARLGQIGNESANKTLVQSILTDSSFKVRIASLRAKSRILQRTTTELYREQDRGIRSAAETKAKISELKRQHTTALKELFKPSYKYNCDYSNEVKAVAAGSFVVSEDPEILPLVFEELKKNCAISFAQRMQKENPRMPYRGNALTSNLQHVISTYGKKAVPLIEKEHQAAPKGDYKYSLLIILNKISQKLAYSTDAAKYVPVHQFDPNLLPQCEEGLLTTESPGIRRELVGILIAHGYVPASAEAQKIIDEVRAKKEDINIKY